MASIERKKKNIFSCVTYFVLEAGKTKKGRRKLVFLSSYLFILVDILRLNGSYEINLSPVASEQFRKPFLSS